MALDVKFQHDHLRLHKLELSHQLLLLLLFQHAFSFTVEQSPSPLFVAHSIIITMAICNLIHIKITRRGIALDARLRDVKKCRQLFSQPASINVPPTLRDYFIVWEPLCGWLEFGANESAKEGG